ncbi:putative U-box domain-containing protein 33 isoform X1 [Iris pallida]|uniref:U-box domain-containing protein 33 isoform X1 n=1 Tax=Iris pallida TaxID=29817 RepID=A0AAX6F2Q3_IRIPA|nr:putative U-box domain-containing protein 33 isoform X1 [Iris pallida]
MILIISYPSPSERHIRWYKIKFHAPCAKYFHTTSRYAKYAYHKNIFARGNLKSPLVVVVVVVMVLVLNTD